VLRKFDLLASRVLSSSRVEKLRDTLLNLEKLDDAREIAKLLTAERLETPFASQGKSSRRTPR